MQTLYFAAVVSFFFFSSPNLSKSHTSTHGVALVHI